MTLRLALIFAATALASVSAYAQEQAAPASQAPSAETKALMESCTARKFETIVERIVDGEMRGSKVTLCGKEGQTDADWANTLRDAVRKVEANPTMELAVKAQIAAALNAEIAKVESPQAVAIAPPAAVARPAERPPEYSILPPFPPAPVAATTSSIATPAPPTIPAPAAKKPRLTIRCSAPGEKGGGSACMALERDTQLTIRADDDLAEGASLHFLRRGKPAGEIALAQMRPGQSLRSRLPPELCSGVNSSKVEIQILGRGANQAAETLGPYSLRC